MADCGLISHYLVGVSNLAMAHCYVVHRIKGVLVSLFPKIKPRI